ncbi:putative GEM-like protein 8 [Vitis vinifera]|uniref:Putative GEM-like protein 8 n=1 Tax=Vitis vinifera TaxID=29760 RepID=A0A438EUJ4_VITVI|nr:putative GEM-like protein 8 [Vitis vinifera]
MRTQHGKKADDIVHGIREHMRIGCKISGTVKGRLSLGTQTLQLGGIRRVSSRFLSWRRREAVEGFPIQYVSIWKGVKQIESARWSTSHPLHITMKMKDAKRVVHSRSAHGHLVITFTCWGVSVLFQWPLPSPQWPIFFCKRSGYIHGHAEIHQVMDPPLPQVVKHHGSKVDRKKKMNRHEKKDYNFVQGIREHVRLGPKISETVKGKLSLGARILQLGGVKRVFKQIFGVREGEKLLKASQCYLSTTAGPLAGLLFISTQRVAFCSERSIKFSSPNGELVRFHYKVSIPLRKVKRVDPSENVKNPSQKYMEIVTVDNFDFWFMGFLNYQKSFNCLQQALSPILNELQTKPEVIQVEMVFLSASLGVSTCSKNKASAQPKTLYKVFINEI